MAQEGALSVRKAEPALRRQADHVGAVEVAVRHKRYAIDLR
jgi:hypothetical protein